MCEPGADAVPGSFSCSVLGIEAAVRAVFDGGARPHRVPLPAGGRILDSYHIGEEGDERRGAGGLEMAEMREEYDFSASRPNPYIERLRKPVTMNLDVANIEYFKAEAARTGVPYQTIINLYLTECREQGKRLAFM